MKQNLIKFLVAILVFGGTLGGVAHLTYAKTNKQLSISQYQQSLQLGTDIQYLKKQDPQLTEAELKEIQLETKKNIANFKKLSTEKKTKIVQIINSGDEKKVTASDDIEVTDNKTLITLSAKSSRKTKDYSTQYTKTFSILGSVVGKWRIRVDYRVTSGKVKKILNKSAYMVQGWGIVTSKTVNKKGWITGNKAALDATFKISGTAYGVPMFKMSKRLKVMGNNKGKRVYHKYWNN